MKSTIFMKKLKKIYNYLTENPKRFNLIFVSICLLFVIVLKIFYVYKNEQIYKEYNYSIGEVTYISYSKQLNIIEYEYYNSNKKIKVRKDSWIFGIPHDIKVKQKFVTIFSNSEYDNSILLFDYPIKDSTDFDIFLKKFKDNPPK